jgi:predicted TIM-barrel fold metal-dependent hydrolase
MLLDINAYIGHWPFRQLRGNTLEAMIDRMNRFGVDKAIVANINGIFYKDTQPANEELYNAIQANPALFADRIIPFAVMNPVLYWWEDALADCQEKFGMKGIRIYPIYHEYEMDDRRLIELVKAARDRGMPVQIPMRMIDLRQRSWLDKNKEMNLNHVAVLVREVPDAQYMVLDTRLRQGAERTTEESAEILRNADILFDTVRGSAVPIIGPNGAGLQQLGEQFGYDKLAFGTETPFVDYCTPFIRVELFDQVDEKGKQMIWSGNARRMLNI